MPKPDDPETHDQRDPDKTDFHDFLLNVRMLISRLKQPHRPAQRKASVLRHAKLGRCRLPARAAKIQPATARHARESCPHHLRTTARPQGHELLSALPFRAP